MFDTVSLGERLLITLKAAAGAPGPQLVLPVGHPQVVLLRPLPARPEFINRSDVKLLTEWRNRFVAAGAYLTEFQATEARTQRWLTEVVVPSNNKILFMVDDTLGRTIGHMGLGFIDWSLRSGEADNIVRGADAPRGTMKRALQELLLWGKETLGLQQLGVRVRSDNTAQEFYRKVGFVEVARAALRRTEEPGMTRWVEDSTVTKPQLELVCMRWVPHGLGRGQDGATAD